MNKVIIFAGLLLAVPAFADEARTVSWFLAHRSEINPQMAACGNDPGNAKHVPACEAAYQAQLTLAAADARAHANASTAALQEQQDQATRAHPEMLPYKLAYCNSLPTADTRRIAGCDRLYAIAQEMVNARRGAR